MLKVVLRYHDTDGKKVFSTLAGYNTEIICTKTFLVSDPRVVVRIKDYNELNNVLCNLNQRCLFAVVVIKVKNIK